jgi:hypothetical protein
MLSIIMSSERRSSRLPSLGLMSLLCASGCATSHAGDDDARVVDATTTDGPDGTILDGAVGDVHADRVLPSPDASDSRVDGRVTGPCDPTTCESGSCCRYEVGEYCCPVEVRMPCGRPECRMFCCRDEGGLFCGDGDTYNRATRECACVGGPPCTDGTYCCGTLGLELFGRACMTQDEYVEHCLPTLRP